MSIPDARLVHLSRSGDAAAFEALVRRHLRAAHAIALAITGEPADVEDVCQDAFITALERLDDCREPERFAAWLLKIVRNRARNYMRDRAARRAALLGVPPPATGAEPAHDAERSDLRDRLTAALSTLPEIQREVVLLHDLEGWRHREVAAALGISEGMSRQHLFNARRALRRLVGTDVYQGYRYG